MHRTIVEMKIWSRYINQMLRVLTQGINHYLQKGINLIMIQVCLSRRLKSRLKFSDWV